MGRSNLDRGVTIPQQSAEWVEAIVKWTRYDYVAVYDYPTTENSDTVTEMFNGDMLQVSRRYRRGDWCLCRVGHVLGWVFLKDVRFIVQGAPPPRPNTRRPKERVQQPSNQSHDVTQHIPYLNQQNEMETQPAIQLQEKLPPILPFEPEPVAKVEVEKRPLIERLISFFQK